MARLKIYDITCQMKHHLKPVPCFMHSYVVVFFLAARVLEDCGAKRQPCGGALWEGGHQYTWQWFPHRKVRAIFKVSSHTHSSMDRKFCLCLKTAISIYESLLTGPGMLVYPREKMYKWPFCILFRHGWNLTVLPNNSGSILRHLGAVPGKDTWKGSSVQHKGCSCSIATSQI